MGVEGSFPDVGSVMCLAHADAGVRNAVLQWAALVRVARRVVRSQFVYPCFNFVDVAIGLISIFFNVEIYCVITTALWSRDGSAVVSLHLL